MIHTWTTRHDLEELKRAHIDIDALSRIFYAHEETTMHGKIMTSNLISLMGNMGLNFDHDELQDVLLELDADSYGEVHWGDFLRWYQEFVVVVMYTNLLRVNSGLPLLYHVPGII